MKQPPKNWCEQKKGFYSQHCWVPGTQALTCRPVILLLVILLLEQTQTPSRYLAKAAWQAKPAHWSTELGWRQADSAGSEKVQGNFQPVCSAQSVFNQTPFSAEPTPGSIWINRGWGGLGFLIAPVPPWMLKKGSWLPHMGRGKEQSVKNQEKPFCNCLISFFCKLHL